MGRHTEAEIYSGNELIDNVYSSRRIYLNQDQQYTVKISKEDDEDIENDGEDFEIYFTIYDSEHKNSFLDGIYVEDGYKKVGDSFTAKATFYTIDEDEAEISSLPEGYTCEWLDVDDNPLGTGLKYIFNNISDDDFSDYHVILYYKGIRVSSNWFTVYNIDETYYHDGDYWHYAYGKAGEEVELQSKFFDYYGNPVDLSSNEFRVVWYDYDSNVPVHIGSTYKVKVSNKGSTDYECVLYKNDKRVATSCFEVSNIDYLYEDNNCGYSKDVYANVGDKVELEGKFFDYYGNPVDISSPEFTLKWYDKNDECVGSGSKYIINKLEEPEDSYSNHYFRCELYKNGVNISNTSFNVYTYSAITYEKETTIIAKPGVSINLTAILKDELGKTLTDSDLKSQEYVTWYKKVGFDDKKDLNNDSLTYNIKKLDEGDFYNNTNKNYYICRVWVGEELCVLRFNILKKEESTTQKPTDKPQVTTSNKTTAPEKKVTAPTKAKVPTAKAGKKKVSLKLKKVSGAKGYLIQYSTNKKFKKPKTKTVTSLKVTLKKLKSKKTYYFRVKAYKLDGKKKIYSKNWSSVKKVKIK